MKYSVIVADPPWTMADKLVMGGKIKRSSDSQYAVLTTADIKSLEVGSLAADDAVLALWVPSAMLEDGMEVMKAWGFKQKQVHVWVKTKIEPIEKPMRKFLKAYKKDPSVQFKYDTSECLAFGMGHLFRQTHEMCLIGTRGKIVSQVKNKAQRSVHFGPVMKHSQKPEDLQDMLDKMFPSMPKLELFARRDKTGWVCVGLECPSTKDEDIRDSLKRLAT